MKKLLEMWDNIVWMIYYKPKTLYKDIKYWFKVNNNKYHWQSAKYCFCNCKPWDTEYMYELQLNWLKESMYFFEHKCNYIGRGHINEIIKWQKLAISLLEIITNKRDLYDIIVKDDIVKIESSIYVNMKNKNRFMMPCRDFTQVRITYSNDMWNHNTEDDLYKEKARRLYNRIILEHSIDWWD